MFNLFDSLVKPIMTYASQVWLPQSKIMKSIHQNTISAAIANLVEAAPKDKIERVHLKFLKWTLGIHKKASNTFCYGDTGRLPIVISVIPQGIRYFERVAEKSNNKDNCLIAKVFAEQQSNNFDWFKVWNNLTTVIKKANKSDVISTKDTEMFLRNSFIEHWKTKLQQQKDGKLNFYADVKHEFGEEIYLQLEGRERRIHISRIRSSAHDLNIERGRYKKRTT